MTTQQRLKRPLNSESGSSMVEFAVISGMLIPMLAGSFTLGMMLSKGLQVSNVCRDAGVLMVRAVTDTKAGLDLSQTQNQRIVVRAANGLGMAKNTSYDPDPNGKALVVLSKVVLVSDNECSAGISPAPTGAPPWNTSNCPNYGSYVFAYRVTIGNTTSFHSAISDPPSADVQSDGTITTANIAKDTANRALHFGTGGILSLNPSTFALVSEMIADVSALNIFSIFNSPTIYSRTIS